jgi:hypothetical protein
VPLAEAQYHFFLGSSASGGGGTILLPTDKAWEDFLTSEGLNQTTVTKLMALSSPDAQAVKWALTLGIRPLAFYHFINVTVTAGNLTNDQVLPTILPTANITVRLDPANATNITFVGAANETDPAAPNTNVASMLVKDIPVVGYPNILLDVVDKVLIPPPGCLQCHRPSPCCK